MREDQTILVPAVLPIRPWDYLRRRRLLAGKTIEQAAHRCHDGARSRADYDFIRRSCEENHRRWEQKGVTLLHRYLVRAIGESTPLDVEVYFQLADLPFFHPTLCRCCCSTEMEPRETMDGASARLDEEGVCTACREDMAAVQSSRRRAA